MTASWKYGSRNMPRARCPSRLLRLPPLQGESVDSRLRHSELTLSLSLSRFNRLVWGYVCTERPMGVLAAGLENGELNLWDAQKVIDGAEE